MRTPVRLTASVLLVLAATTAVTTAQTLAPVPMPTPRPKAAMTMAGTRLAAAPLQLAGQPRLLTPRRVAENEPANAQQPAVVPPPAAVTNSANGEATAFNETQRALVDKVSTYLSNLQTLVGRFVQVGPDGKRTQGEFYLEKPGKVRFEYDPPSPIQLIADGSSVVVRDRKLATQDLYPLSQTPLRFLLSNDINLLRDTNVTAVYADDVFVTVVIEENKPVLGTNRLMMMFGAKDMQLRQWTITDPQGYDTTVAIYDLDTKTRPDPKLFKIDYTRYHN